MEKKHLQNNIVFLPSTSNLVIAVEPQKIRRFEPDKESITVMQTMDKD